MKKIIALALIAIMTVALCIGVSANTSLDRLTINNNTLPTMPDDETNLRNADEITIAKGDKLFILGWAYSDESNLKEVVYTIDGVEHACAENYRDRGDLAQVFGIDASLCVHAGIGQDDNAFELVGIDTLDDGTYTFGLVAKYNDGTEEPLGAKGEYTLIVGTGVAPQQSGGLRDFDSAKGDKLSYDQILVNGAEIANGNDAVIAAKKLVDGSDGSITAIAMHGWYGNANSKIASYGYMIDGGEPVYGDFAVGAEDAVIAAGGESRYTVSVDVTGLQDGEEHEIWVVVKLENGDIVKLNRYDNRGQEGGKDREVYVIYKAPKTEAPSTQPETQPETQQPQTGDAAVAMFAVLAVLAMGAVVVFAKKRSF
jgi:LPXTG-motif cell wall-anchored protein